MPNRRTILIVALLVVGTIFGTALLSSAPLVLDPDTNSACYGATQQFSLSDSLGHSVRGIGAFPDVPGGRAYGELFDSSSYYLSWADDGVSESIAVAGGVRHEDGCANPIQSAIALFGSDAFTITNKYRFEFKLQVSTVFIDEFHQDDIPAGIIQLESSMTPWSADAFLPARTLKIDGTTYVGGDGATKTIPDGSILRVYLIMRAFDTRLNPTDIIIAWDEARLLYATPELQWESGLYEVGETARLRYSVPFAVDKDGQTAFFVTITNLNTNVPIAGWDNKAIVSPSGVIEFPVTPDMFKLGSVNRLRADMKSPVFRAALTDTATIDNKDLAPHMDSITFDKAEYREGDTVKITLKGSPNPTTQSPIVKFYVLASIGGTIVYDAFVESSTLTVSAPITGILKVEASAYDEAGRSSAVLPALATIGNVIVLCEVYPELPECGGGGGGGGFGIPLWAWFIIFGAIAVLLAILVPIPAIRTRLIVLLVGVVLVLLGIVFMR